MENNLYNYEPPLLPCRVCQKPAQMYANVYYVDEYKMGTFRVYYVECKVCPYRRTREYDTKVEAMQIWNKLYGHFRLTLVKTDKDGINGAHS